MYGYRPARSFSKRATRSKYVYSSLFPTPHFNYRFLIAPILRLTLQDIPSEKGILYPEARSILQDGEFGRIDPTGWYTHYKTCLQHFVKSSQFNSNLRSIAAFINIRLPAQHSVHPNSPQAAASFISLRPYVRRLIFTAQDTPIHMRTFFGPDWEAGVGCIYKQERINYLFAAKSGGWAKTKASYDILPDEQTPFLRPLRDPSEDEIRAAEARWSEWLAMEDWMVGVRSPW
ncbi:hypothetical protein N7509_000134 [Penicillium cosmopolitanum]|uniref:Uncharacterized protein n=1 Tax=Penicillium cosmopolitanum TaxID=1131564 RepID=A0A9X0BF82_9EURO|nr:uncharacterized protein N7509_000134 [Penicillium cosmopolitanum]KAJ5415036.1 hypothetical protein N7509_000134 [Penicillium cosmopolitanum]